MLFCFLFPRHHRASPRRSNDNISLLFGLAKDVTPPFGLAKGRLSALWLGWEFCFGSAGNVVGCLARLRTLLCPLARLRTLLCPLARLGALLGSLAQLRTCHTHAPCFPLGPRSTLHSFIGNAILSVLTSDLVMHWCFWRSRTSVTFSHQTTRGVYLHSLVCFSVLCFCCCYLRVFAPPCLLLHFPPFSCFFPVFPH